MAPHRPATTSIMHATVDAQTLQSLPMPAKPFVEKEFLAKQHELQLGIFCEVYSALLDDVEAFDPLLESKFSKEIIRIVTTFASSFGTHDEQFNERLGMLNRQALQTAAVEGLSGATVMDYLVSLMAEKSGNEGLETLDNYENRLGNLGLAKAIREISGRKGVLGGEQSPKSLLRGIGLPKTISICVGPHAHSGNKHRDYNDEGEEKNTAETDKAEEDHKEVEQNIHVVASSPESFSDLGRKRWAWRMQYERMRSVSIRNFQQVCTTERRFFAASARGSTYGECDGNPESELVRRYNMIPYWLAKSQCAVISASATAPITASPTRPDPRIGVFGHFCETAGVFDIYAGFKRRARCYKCASVYVYRLDYASVCAESDLDGPQWSEPVHNWAPTGSNDQEDSASCEDGSFRKGSPCAEPLCHLLCSELM